MREQPVSESRRARLVISVLAWLMFLAAVAIVALGIAASMSGCAHYSVNPATGEGSSYGFLRSMTVSRTFDPATGKMVQETIATQSTTGDVLMGLNELTGTLVDAAGKARP